MKHLIFFLAIFVAFPALGASGKGPVEFVEKKTKGKLEKIPKSMFLIKRTKINADVGEPQFYPVDAQLRTVINDPAFHDTKKFE